MNLCLCGHTYYVHGPACGECEGCREFREQTEALRGINLATLIEDAAMAIGVSNRAVN